MEKERGGGRNALHLLYPTAIMIHSEWAIHPPLRLQSISLISQNRCTPAKKEMGFSHANIHKQTQFAKKESQLNHRDISLVKTEPCSQKSYRYGNSFRLINAHESHIRLNLHHTDGFHKQPLQVTQCTLTRQWHFTLKIHLYLSYLVWLTKSKTVGVVINMEMKKCNVMTNTPNNKTIFTYLYNGH